MLNIAKSSTFIHLLSIHYFIMCYTPQVHHAHTTPPYEHDPHTTLQHIKYPTTHTILTLSSRLFTHLVSQAVIGHPLFTILHMTLDHSWPSSHITITYSGPSSHTSDTYILLFFISIISITTLWNHYTITTTHHHRHITLLSFSTPNVHNSSPLVPTLRALIVI